MSFTTTQLATGRILRDQPELRSIEKREKVWLLVRQSIPNAKFSTVERCIRNLQNTLGLYKLYKNDGRYIKEQEYKEYFGVKI